MPSPPPLDRPVYQMNEAARLLNVPDKTLRRWLDGDRRFERVIEPLIRPERTGDTAVTWGEFVEAGFLRECRNKRLPIERLRPLIASLRENLQTPYPLAQARPLYSDGMQLLWREQQHLGIDRDLFLVVQGSSGDPCQLVLAPVAEQFFARVEFEPPDAESGVAAKWYPWLPYRRIVLDPRVSFGLPHIAGVRTETIAEFRAAGESVSKLRSVFGEYGLTGEDIKEAVRFEDRLWSRRAA